VIRLAKGILCVICVTLTACATQTGMSEGFDRSVKEYNRMLRWHELENAVTTYGDPELQNEYLKRVDTLKTRGLSITDFRVLSTKYLPEKQTGNVVTEFDYYILPSNRVKTISCRQVWVYREEIKSWKVKSGFPAFE